MTKAEKLKHCVGCEDDFYNDKNPIGVKECWMLENAKMVTRLRIGIWQKPPYDASKLVEVFQCRKEKGNVLIEPKVLTKEGYWK